MFSELNSTFSVIYLLVSDELVLCPTFSTDQAVVGKYATLRAHQRLHSSIRVQDLGFNRGGIADR